MRLRAIVCDIDGCLGPEAIGPADTASLARVADHNRLARERGDRPPLTLCTGRPLPFADAMARIVGAVDLPIICEAGAMLMDPHTYTWELDPAIRPEHIRALGEVRAWVAAQFAGSYFEEGKVAALTVFHPQGPGFLEREVVGPVRAMVESAGLPFRVSMTWTCINVEPEMVDKASGIDRLCARMGVVPADLAGIGDTMSDLPIRQRVRLFACPANAKPEIKAHADFVSAEPEARGVLDILRWLGEDARWL